MDVVDELYRLLVEKNRKAFSLFKQFSGGDNHYEAFRRARPTSQYTEVRKIGEYIVLKSRFWSPDKYKVDIEKGVPDPGYYPAVFIIGNDERGRLFCHRLPYNDWFENPIDTYSLEQIKKTMGFEKDAPLIWDELEDGIYYRVQGDIAMKVIRVNYDDMRSIITEIWRENCNEVAGNIQNALIKQMVMKLKQQMIKIRNERRDLEILSYFKKLRRARKYKAKWLEKLWNGLPPAYRFIIIVQGLENNEGRSAKEIFERALLEHTDLIYDDFLDLYESIVRKDVEWYGIASKLLRKVRRLFRRMYLTRIRWERGEPTLSEEGIRKVLINIIKKVGGIEKKFTITIGNHRIGIIGVNIDQLTKTFSFRGIEREFIYRIKDFLSSSDLVFLSFIILRLQTILFSHREHLPAKIDVNLPEDQIAIVTFRTLRAHVMHDDIRENLR